MIRNRTQRPLFTIRGGDFAVLISGGTLESWVTRGTKINIAAHVCLWDKSSFRRTFARCSKNRFHPQTVSTTDVFSDQHHRQTDSVVLLRR